MGGVFSEVRRHGVLTAGFSEHDPPRMMHLRGLDEGLLQLAELTSPCRQVSIDATRCQTFAEKTPEEGLGNWSLSPTTPAKAARKVLQPRRGRCEPAEDDNPP